MKRYLTILLLLTALVQGVSARSVNNINGRWTFFTGNDTDTSNSSVIYLPHTWNSDATTAGSAYYRGVGNYTKEIDIPLSWREKRVFMRIGGAATVTDIIVNGKYLSGHYGGNSAFTVELTDKLRFGASNKLWIVVNNSPRFDVLPTAGEENIYGGIFRNVELIVTEPLSINPAANGSDGVYISTNNLTADKAEGVVKLDLLNMAVVPDNARARIRFTNDANKVVAQNSVHILDLSPTNSSVTLPFTVTHPRMWEGVEDPYLYNVEITITSGNDMITDSLCVRTGFRTVGIDENNNFTLNGKPYKLRGVITNRDRMMVGTAMTPFQIEEDVNLICEMGANAIRVSGGQHNDYFYSLCDEAGLVVWNEMPFTGATYLTDRDFIDTENFRRNGKEQLTEMIMQLYNHPSVAMWGIFSDISTKGDDPIPYIRELNELAHRLDMGRLTAASSTQDGEINFVTNLVSFHQSFGWTMGMPSDISVWMEQMRRSWTALPAALSYSAGGSILQQSEKLEKPLIMSNHHPENWQTYFHEEYMKSAVDAPQFWGVFVGNMFDFGAVRRNWGDAKGTNDHGLVTFDRKDRKDSYYLYKANWNKTDPFVFITGKRLDMRTSRAQTVKVYSNQSEVELFMDNRSLGKREGVNGIFTWENLNLRGGMNRIEARSEFATDRATINVDTSGAAGSRQAQQIHRIANQ